MAMCTQVLLLLQTGGYPTTPNTPSPPILLTKTELQL